MILDIKIVNFTAEKGRKVSQFKQKREAANKNARLTKTRGCKQNCAAGEKERLQTKAVPYPVPILFIAEPFLSENGVGPISRAGNF